ncbi:MAG TPA: DNA primase, partial [Vicinamibacteria bacterium]|nr:DNA primase [Vicinamibacteria bacterium]
VFKFVMLHERVNFPEAVESLARRYGIAVPARGSEIGADRKEREEVLALMEAACQHFTRTLWTAPGDKAREYLLGRGFKKETLERIRAGAARDSWDDVFNTFKSRFSPGALLTAGLILERQDKSGHYDRFRGRAVFPILNEGGKVVAFGARSLDGSEPKYLNSPETPVYSKSRTLYGLSWARDAIRKEGRIVLMEGYLDVARALEAGVETAVATCGTALTSFHGRLLRRFAEKIVVNFDQDDAGQKAARKSLDVLVEEGLRVHVVELPPGHDPDTFLKEKGGSAYAQRLDSAPEAMEWMIRRAAAEHETRTPAGKAAYLEALLPVLVKIDSAVERAAWLPRIAERGGLDEAAAREELRRALRGGRGPLGPLGGSPPEAAPLPGPVRAEALIPAERLLVWLLLRSAEGVDEALGELADTEIEGLHSAPVLRAARSLYLKNVAITSAALTEAVAEDERSLLTAVAMGNDPNEGVSALDCVKELKRGLIRARMAKVQRALKAAPAEEQGALLEEKGELARRLAAVG